MIGFGIDIGGTGMKGAPVNLTTGELIAPRFKIKTPKPATPEAVAEVAAQILDHFGQSKDLMAPIGVAIPAIADDGVARSAANIDPTWVGLDADALFTERLQREVHIINDADAAGLAELHFGAARGLDGLTIVLTLGTGIGSAFLFDGELVPHSELGHLVLDIDGVPVVGEKWAAAKLKDKAGLSWIDWAARLQTYLTHVERLFTPRRFILGGGISKNADSFVPLLDLEAEVLVAAHRNNAGIIGAALNAA